MAKLNPGTITSILPNGKRFSEYKPSNYHEARSCFTARREIARPLGWQTEWVCPLPRVPVQS